MTVRTLAEVTQLAKDLETFYSDFQTQCDTEDTYYNLKFPVPEVAGFSAHRPATARVAVDAAAAQIDPAAIVITVHPRTEDPNHKEAAIRNQEFYHGCWNAILRNNSTLYTRTLKHMYLYGVGIWKLMYDSTVFQDAPESESELATWRSSSTNDFPFMVFLKHPRNVMPDPSYFTLGRYTYVIEKYKRKFGEVKDMYPDWEGSGHEINDDVEWIEYWDSEHYMKICDGEEIAPCVEHGYGFNPYKIIDAGLGYEDADGLPENRWRGILNASHYDLELEARLLYQMEAILRMQAFGPQDFEVYDPIVTQEEALKFQASYEFHPATKNIFPYGIRRAQPAQVNIPPQVFDVLGFVKQGIDDATVSAGARGQRPTGAASGYMAAVIVGMARIKFGPALNALQRVVEESNKCFAMFVENFAPNGIAVWGKIDRKSFDIVVKAKDIAGYYVNEVQLTSIAPEEESRRIADGLRLYQAGLASKEYIQINYLKMRDTIGDLKQKLVENALDNPMVQQQLIQSAIQSPEFQAQLGLVGGGEAASVSGGLDTLMAAAGNPLGNQGITPSPMNQGIPATKVPMAAGSPEEMALVARQRSGQPQMAATAPDLTGGIGA